MSVTSPVTGRVTSPVVSRVTDGRRRRASGINIASLLFGAGEVGVWYDPSDITTLFQDEAGSTPVTTLGQTVRRVLDKSGNGFHATQADAAKAFAYGRHPFGGIRNQLTFSEDFSNAAWTKTQCSVALATGPNGPNTAYAILSTSASSSLTRLTRDHTVVVGQPYRLTYIAKAGTKSTIGSRASSDERVFFSLSTGDITVNGTVHSDAAMVDLGDGWWECSCTITPAATPHPVWVGDLLNTTAAVIGEEQVYIAKVQFELGGTKTGYQKVVTQFDVTEADVPTVYYLQADGVDDFLETDAIDFTGTDKMTVFAGVRKLSDAATGLIFEYSIGLNTEMGAFNAVAPSGAGANSYRFSSRGTSANPARFAGTGTFAVAPDTSVLTGIANIGGPKVELRRNGASIENNTTDGQGTGNYGNHKLYIGSRAGTSLFFNGPIYGLTIRGAETPLATIQIVEAELAKRAGITL